MHNHKTTTMRISLNRISLDRQSTPSIANLYSNEIVVTTMLKLQSNRRGGSVDDGIRDQLTDHEFGSGYCALRAVRHFRSNDPSRNGGTVDHRRQCFDSDLYICLPVVYLSLATEHLPRHGLGDPGNGSQLQLEVWVRHSFVCLWTDYVEVRTNGETDRLCYTFAFLCLPWDSARV